MLENLWQPIRIGSMELKNRVVMPPMVTNYATTDGFVTDRSVNYYEARARGGVGLIILEATYVDRLGRAFTNQLGISDDAYLPGLKRLVDVIHGHGAKAAVQLHHGGRMASSTFTGVQPAGPSALAGPGGEAPREMTVPEIRRVIACFAEAAERARRAGFDGVELHAGHAYLIDQFLSRWSNKRRDEYGGDVENRARFLIEAIRAIRKTAGFDFAVWCRINGKQYGLEEGETLEDAKQVARMAQDASADAIHVSATGPQAPVSLNTAIFTPAVIADLAEGVKKAVTVPVVAVGRITPEAGDRMIRDGQADLVAMGKELLADPDLPDKAKSGKMEDINPCIVCFSCLEDLRRPGVTGIRCRVNPLLGREGEPRAAAAAKRKRVLVVGGGPGGMEAAIVAARRGHAVTVWEREPGLGGQLIPASVPPHKDRMATLNAYLQTQLRKLNVKIETGRAATAADVVEQKPDVVILATGVRPAAPDIRGLDKIRPVQAVDVLEGRCNVGSRVVVIGGELVGCETAEYLADKGKKVTVTRRGKAMATGVGPMLRSFFLSRLERKGVTLLAGVAYNEVTREGLSVTTADGKTALIEVDTVVLATGATPEQGLRHEIEGKVPELYLVGDCVEPRTVREAIEQGFRVGLSI